MKKKVDSRLNNSRGDFDSTESFEIVVEPSFGSSEGSQIVVEPIVGSTLKIFAYVEPVSVQPRHARVNYFQYSVQLFISGQK